MEPIKENELRVGNWVNNSDENYQISSATISGIERGDYTVYPIQLNEWWLNLFGFEKLTDTRNGFKSTTYTFENGKFIVSFNNGILEYPCCVNKRYVHELQNLYYTLFNRELTIIKNDNIREIDN